MTSVEEYLDQIPMWAAKKNSLEDIRTYMEELGSPDNGMKIIHVAGTNGKGSVCAFLTSVLMEAGYKVATFISPHLEETRERFLLNRKMVCVNEYEQAFQEVKGLSETMAGKGYQPPSYFEFLFYMFMVICKSRKPDFVILETGLGGRLDVTNVIRKPVAVIITSVSMDHMEYLGHTIEEIAWEKAGIIKPGVPVIYDNSCDKVSAVIESRARQLDSPIYPVSQKDFTVADRNEMSAKIMIQIVGSGEMILEVMSIAEYQLMNAAVAVYTLGILKKRNCCIIKPEDFFGGIKHSYWPGRMEQVLPQVYLDGAHNIGGIDALIQTVHMLDQRTGKKAHLLFASVSDKDYARMIKRISSEVKLASVSIARLKSERGMDPEVLAEEFRMWRDCPVEAFATVEKALGHLMKVKCDDFVFCVGSLYLIGEIKGIMDRYKNIQA